MPRYAVLLRGVNVGGVNIRMATLREALASAGYPGATTFLASGNIVLESPVADRAALAADLASCLKQTFAYDARFVLLELEALRRVVAAYPFEPPGPARHAYVVFGSEPSSLEGLVAKAGSLDPAVERVSEADGVIYWEVLRGQTLTSAFGKATGSWRLKEFTTTRNMNTLEKMIG